MEIPKASIADIGWLGGAPREPLDRKGAEVRLEIDMESSKTRSVFRGICSGEPFVGSHVHLQESNMAT